MSYNPNLGDYDYGLGIEPQIIDYAMESTIIESRISSVRCYLLQQNPSGSVIGSVAAPFTVMVYTDTTPNFRATIWNSGPGHPDLRGHVNNGLGAVFVSIDGTPATRVLEVEDLQNNHEFAAVKRVDLLPPRVELVFNAGFDASLHAITYYYTTMQPGIDIQLVKRGQDDSESLFGWTQFLDVNCTDAFQGRHQLLVRMPLTTRDLIINDEGKVSLEENESWMIWTPYVRDFDVLIVPPQYTQVGVDERYEIVNKRDSVIQGSLITQRFKLKLLERTDPRYRLPYVTT